ncbi:MAG: ABC transporter permease [Actinomycetota bacterium]
MSDAAIATKDDGRPDQEAERRRGSTLTTVLLRQETTLIFVIVVIGVLTTVRNSSFSSRANITAIASASVIYFVMACGASLITIGGGLDFSVGVVFTLGGLVCGWMLVHGVAWPLAVLIGVGVGALAGIVNNCVIVYLHVPPIIATLGTFFVGTGISTTITGGNDIVPLPSSFQKLGQGELVGVPYVVWYAIAVGAAFWFALEKTRFGINVRALGGNRQAAIGNGLRVGRLDFALYILGGGTAALAGVIYAAQVGSGQVEAGGPTTTLNVVTAVLIGGVSLFGGLGTITGVAVGAILLSEIDNALIVASIPPQYNTIIIGSILICAVAIDHVRRKRLYRQ